MGGTESLPKDRIKVMFVNAPSPDSFVYIRDTNRSGRRSSERTIWPQTSLAMMAGVLDECEVKIIDCVAERLSYKALYECMKEFAPGWVVTNPISSIFVHDLIVAHYAKSLKAKTVIISPHAKALRKDTHERFPSVDHIISFERGGLEPEWKLRELITGADCSGKRFEDIPPARQDLLPTERYSLPFIGKNFTFITISRGCPYQCIFCRQAVTFEGQVRYRSVDSVIEEIKRYELRNIAIHSDTATLDKEWLYKFCERVPEGVRWICNSRVDTVTQDLLYCMKDNGCWMICYGIESGDDTVLKKNKKGATCEQAKKAVSWAKKAGLKVWAYFMLGLYGDSYETMQRTIDFACKLKPDIANFAVSAPYPGTEWNKIASEQFGLSEGMFDQNFACDVSQPDCLAWLVKHMQRKAYLKFYLSWRGVLFLVQCFPHWGFLAHVLADHIRSTFKKNSGTDKKVPSEAMV